MSKKEYNKLQLRGQTEKQIREREAAAQAVDMVMIEAAYIPKAPAMNISTVEPEAEAIPLHKVEAEANLSCGAGPSGLAPKIGIYSYQEKGHSSDTKYADNKPHKPGKDNSREKRG